MVARLLRDKGILEYLNASAELKKKYPAIIFKLAGGTSDNPAALKVEEVQDFCKTHNLDYMGQVDHICQTLQNSSVFVLPSYREGMPRAGLEALSCGRPIITTDTEGCRDLISDNGFKIPIQNQDALMHAMEQTILLTQPELNTFAKNSRKLAETKFDVRLVNQAVLEQIYNSAI
jgi:glycosyltransferase involved in cell wall biosynthesis